MGEREVISNRCSLISETHAAPKHSFWAVLGEGGRPFRVSLRGGMYFQKLPVGCTASHLDVHCPQCNDLQES